MITSIKKKFAVKLLFFFLALIWFTGIISPLFMELFPGAAILLPFIKIAYSPVCHQIPYKTMAHNGHSLMVCSRCFGIYTGILLMSLFSFFISFKKLINTRLLILFSLPMLADVIFTVLGIYSYNKISAYSTGVVFGSIVFAYILIIVFENF